MSGCHSPLLIPGMDRLIRDCELLTLNYAKIEFWWWWSSKGLYMCELSVDVDDDKLVFPSFDVDVKWHYFRAQTRR
jgi:hypothetical protein